MVETFTPSIEFYVAWLIELIYCHLLVCVSVCLIHMKILRCRYPYFTKNRFKQYNVVLLYVDAKQHLCFLNPHFISVEVYTTLEKSYILE